MLVLHPNPGSQFTDSVGDPWKSDGVARLFDRARRLLEARGQGAAASVLQNYPFCFITASTDFGNHDYTVLLVTVPLLQYEKLRELSASPQGRSIFAAILGVLKELGEEPFSIVAELGDEAEHPIARVDNRLLVQREIKQLVYGWIGVSGGYLGDFSYRTHREFYAELGLGIDPNTLPGTTRERFMTIIGNADAAVQARILRGILEKYPPGSTPERTEALHTTIKGWLARLGLSGPVPSPTPISTSEVVERALRDTEELIRTSGATSGVDRIHTAIHGYLKQICMSQGLTVDDAASLPQLFKLLRESHPAFQPSGPRSDDITRVLRACGSILDSLQPIRNMASVAHPNDSLLSDAEAMLVVNVTRTVLHYVDSKLLSYARSTGAGSSTGSTG